MPWVVDTCLLLDIGLDDPRFASRSECLLEEKAPAGLLVSPVTFIELAPAFGGDSKLLEEFLLNLGIHSREDWLWEDTREANAAWFRHIRKRRSNEAARRPIADILLGAFASRFEGLLTRKRADFSIFPALPILEP